MTQTHTDDLSAAETVLADFATRNAGKPVDGCIYDRELGRKIRAVHCKPEPMVAHPLDRIFERAIRSGAPVSIIDGARRADFNVGGVS